MYIHQLYSVGGDDCDIHVKISLFKLYRRFLGDVMHVVVISTGRIFP